MPIFGMRILIIYWRYLACKSEPLLGKGVGKVSMEVIIHLLDKGPQIYATYSRLTVNSVFKC